MGLSSQLVELRDVGASGTARLDNRFHDYSSSVAPTLALVRHARALGAVITSLTNGPNLTASSYADPDEDAAATYLSVSAVSSGVLVLEDATQLRASPAVVELLDKGHALEAGALVITRSGTPGIPWPVKPVEGRPLIAAGFMMRAECPDEETALYLAAVLNHPVWRLLSRGLSAGKRQDNIDQRAVRGIPIPWPAAEVRRAAAAEYEAAMVRIESAFASAEAFHDECDRLLAPFVGEPPPIVGARLWSRDVALEEVAMTGLRADCRWHGESNQATRRAVVDPMPLAQLIARPARRGRQPAPVQDDDVLDEYPLCVSTANVQQGQIVWADVKPTAQTQAQVRSLEPGDLVIAMDGVGSLGKAAVADPPARAAGTCLDSHVASLRVRGDVSPYAICCYLNSSWGRRQTEGLMTGATGQTQLTGADLGRVLIPEVLIAASESVAGAFQDALRAWVPPKMRAREILAEAGANLTKRLVDSGAITHPANHDAESLRRMLDRLY